MKITQVTMTLNLKGRKEIFSEPLKTGQVTVKQHGKFTKLSVGATLEQSPFRENTTMETQNPVVVSITFDTPVERFCAQYQHRDWWSRPEFGDSYESVPERTQSLLVQYEDGLYGCFIPMVGEKMKCYIQGKDKYSIDLVMTAYTGGIHRFEEVGLVFGEGTSFYETVERTWKEACSLLQVPDKQGRRYPELFEYLGWCSWDAFYTDITEEKVREKVKELTEKEVPVRWILLDDGWLSVKEQRLYSLEPEQSKFPNGFRKLTEDIKSETGISHVGVWHALGGYWGGVLPGSEAALECKDFLYTTKNEKMIPHYQPEKGFGFFRKWYTLLRNQGIDFVKVDGQSALKNYYMDNEEIGKVSKGTHEGLESAVSMLMGGNLINCMGMAIENTLHRPSSGISRNSDDFVPNDENGFKEHMMQNAYNAIYYSQVYYGDWDMFWTKHPDAGKHAIVRAISGGPIYVSDRIGETDLDVLAPLIYHDGRILRMERSALPTLDCIFESPLTKRNISLTNIVNGTGAAAIFHLGENKEPIATKIAPKDIYGLMGEEFLVYQWKERRVQTVAWDQQETYVLEPNQEELLLMIPKRTVVTPIGLADKYMSCHSVERVIEKEGKSQVFLKDGGCFSFHSEKKITKIDVEEKEMTHLLKEEQGLYHLPLEEQEGPCLVSIYF